MRLSFALTLLAFLMTDAAGIDGQLQLRVDCFHHPSRRDRWGNVCDLLSDCDPHFRFCLTDVDPTSGKCRLMDKKFGFHNHIMLGACSKAASNFPALINFPVKSPRQQLSLVLTINEQNKYSSNRLIDELVFSVVPGVKTVANGGTAPTALTPLAIRSRIFTSSDQPRVKLSAVLRCAKNRYGPSCSVECAPSDRYTCREDGSRQCSPGWRGADCHAIDHCSLLPCKDWAVCSHVNDTFQCTCDGRTGPQCRAGFDACLNSRCANGATCVSDEGRPRCQCAAGWLGRLCDARDPCASPDACGPQGRCRVVTTDDERVHAICDCAPRWTGPKCRQLVSTTTRPSIAAATQTAPQPVVKNSSTAVIAIVILSVLLVALISAGGVVLLRWRRKRKKKRYMHRHIVQGNPSYHVAKRQSSAYDTTYEDPDNVLAFDSGIYAEPGVVYSCIDLTDEAPGDGTVESELPSTPGIQPSARSLANSVSSVCSSRTGVRYVRANAQ